MVSLRRESRQIIVDVVENLKILVLAESDPKKKKIQLLFEFISVCPLRLRGKMEFQFHQKRIFFFVKLKKKNSHQTVCNKQKQSLLSKKPTGILGMTSIEVT